MKLSPIPRIGRLSAVAFERDFAPSGRPLVVTHAIEDWPARRWSPRLLRERSGAADVDVYVLKDDRIQFDPRRGFLREQARLADCVDDVDRASAAREGAGAVRGDSTGAKWYVRCRLNSLPAELREDVRVPDYCARGLGLRKQLLLAARRTVSPLHFDRPRGLVAQLYGRSRFILFSPEDSPYLYPCSLLSPTPRHALVDPEKPSRAFARFALAHGFSCHLEPGDMLFLPPRWWQHSRALDVSIAVHFCWSTAALYPLVLASAAYELIRGLDV